LVAELSELLPQIAPAAAVESAPSPSLLAALEASLASPSAETEGLQSLRAAVATAQARPRDVDVMLDLVSRADAIAGVLKAHDRYRAAIESAVSALKGEKPDEPAPRW
jgi:hypothetical protein